MGDGNGIGETDLNRCRFLQQQVFRLNGQAAEYIFTDGIIELLAEGCYGDGCYIFKSPGGNVDRDGVAAFASVKLMLPPLASMAAVFVVGVGSKIEFSHPQITKAAERNPAHNNIPRND